jgi:hypothetical protein
MIILPFWLALGGLPVGRQPFIELFTAKRHEQKGSSFNGFFDASGSE